MTPALPDGRVPMDVLLDEKDKEFLAEWDAADAEALSTIEAVPGIGDRPVPDAEFRASSARLGEYIGRPAWLGQLLIECGGMGLKDPPADDIDLWLDLAADVASPQGPMTGTS
jgi:hypothetical protein